LPLLGLGSTRCLRDRFGKGDKYLGPSLGKRFFRKFYFWRFEALAVLAFVALLGWSFLTPGATSSAGSRDQSIRRDGIAVSPFEFPPLAVTTALRDRDAASRQPVYPYSIIPGGLVSVAELRSAVAHDPVVAAHYAAFDLANARAVQVKEARAVYVSYRRGDDVFWTSKKLRLAVGETLVTDGQHIARTRCGNQVSDEPRMPVSLAGDPEPQMLDTPVPYEIIEPFVASIGGEIGGGGIPANAVPSFALTGAGGGVGGTIGGPGISSVPIIPATGGVFPGPGNPPPISTPEPGSLILLSTGFGAARLFRKYCKT
jgi:hypothetical protein